MTQAQWHAVMENNPSIFPGDSTRPVEQMNWWEAVAYANALSKREGLKVCYDLVVCTNDPGKDMEYQSVLF